MELLFDFKKEAVLRLHWNMRWSFGTCFTLGVEICHMKPGTCANVGRIHAFLIARQRKKYSLSSPNIQHEILFFIFFSVTLFCCIFLVWVIRGDGTYTECQISWPPEKLYFVPNCVFSILFRVFFINSQMIRYFPSLPIHRARLLNSNTPTRRLASWDQCDNADNQRKK